MTDEKSGSSTKRLVKILVIVGIGIPVIVELMTLFNLVNVQIFEDEKIAKLNNNEAVTQVSTISEGDTLFVHDNAPLVIERFLVKVTPLEWRFEFGLRAVEKFSQQELQIVVDSLRLQSGRVLPGVDYNAWKIEDDRPAKIYKEWKLPNGDVPQKIYISVMQNTPRDSASRTQQVLPIDKIPVRYDQE